MLSELHIQNYAVIDNVVVEFYPGLNLLSGETGSGKSIIVDALALALGARGSPDVIRTGADRAIITAVFRPDATDQTRVTTGITRGATPTSEAPWTKWLDEYGIAGAAESEI